MLFWFGSFAILCFERKQDHVFFSPQNRLIFGFCLNLVFWNNYGKLELELGDTVYSCFSWHTIFRAEIGVLSSHVQDLKSCQAGWQEGIFLNGYIRQNCTCDGPKVEFAHGCSVGHNPLAMMNLPQPLTRRGFWFKVNCNQNIQLEADFKYSYCTIQWGVLHDKFSKPETISCTFAFTRKNKM